MREGISDMVNNEDYPKISIVTVCFNSEKTIEQTILSVINQTYSNIEYIIIDGKSTDGTVDIIEKYQDKIAYWVSEPDGGIYDAMNKGIDRATGGYIYFIGSDDYLCTHDILDKVAQILYAKKTDLLCASVWSVHESLNLQISAKNRFDLQDVFYGYHIPHQGMFVKTIFMKKYKFNCKYKMVADYDFFLTLYFREKVKIDFIDDKIAYYSTSGFSSTEVKLRINEDILVMEENSIPVRYINNHKKKIRFFYIKNRIKKILSILGVYRYLIKKKGWQEHECNLIYCRWCN